MKLKIPPDPSSVYQDKEEAFNINYSSVDTSQWMIDENWSNDIRGTGVRDNAKKIKYESVHSKYAVRQRA